MQMKVFVQLPLGDKYELIVNAHTTIEQARDMLIQQYDDFPIAKNEDDLQPGESFLIYQFVFHGRILNNPEPFSGLKEGSRVILYIKHVYDKPFPVEEEHNTGNLMTEIADEFIAAADWTLVDQIYNEDNSFWSNHSEVQSIETLFQSDNLDAFNEIVSDFVRERYSVTLRHSDVKVGTILNMVGSGPLIPFGYDSSQTIDCDTNFYNNDIYWRYPIDTLTDQVKFITGQFSTDQSEKYNQVLDGVQDLYDIDIDTLEAESVYEIVCLLQKYNFDVQKVLEEFHLPE